MKAILSADRNWEQASRQHSFGYEVFSSDYDGKGCGNGTENPGEFPERTAA